MPKHERIFTKEGENIAVILKTSYTVDEAKQQLEFWKARKKSMESFRKQLDPVLLTPDQKKVMEVIKLWEKINWQNSNVPKDPQAKEAQQKDMDREQQEAETVIKELETILRKENFSVESV